MALDDIIRSGVTLADSLTTPLQSSITLQRWIGQDAFGKPTYATSEIISCIIEHRLRLKTLSDGRQLQARAVITIPRPLSANGASGRREPIDLRDKITLADGTTGRIVDVEGVLDPDTQRPYAIEIWLGDQSG